MAYKTLTTTFRIPNIYFDKILNILKISLPQISTTTLMLISKLKLLTDDRNTSIELMQHIYAPLERKCRR